MPAPTAPPPIGEQLKTSTGVRTSSYKTDGNRNSGQCLCGSVCSPYGTHESRSKWLSAHQATLICIPFLEKERWKKICNKVLFFFSLLYLFPTSHHAKSLTCNNRTEVQTEERTASKTTTGNDVFRAQPATSTISLKPPVAHISSRDQGSNRAPQRRIRMKKKKKKG